MGGAASGQRPRGSRRGIGCETFDQFNDLEALVGRQSQEGLEQTKAFDGFVGRGSEPLLQLCKRCWTLHFTPLIGNGDRHSSVNASALADRPKRHVARPGQNSRSKTVGPNRPDTIRGTPDACSGRTPRQVASMPSSNPSIKSKRRSETRRIQPMVAMAKTRSPPMG